MDKEKTIAAAKKFLEDQKVVSRYLRGEATKEEITARGIVLATPVEAK